VIFSTNITFLSKQMYPKITR